MHTRFRSLIELTWWGVITHHIDIIISEIQVTSVGLEIHTD